MTCDVLKIFIKMFTNKKPPRNSESILGGSDFLINS